MKLLIYTLLLLLLASCSYRTLEGRAKPVYFSADKAVFTDTFYRARMVYYQDLMGLSYPCADVVELRQGEAVKKWIAKPTFFRKENREFLVYPGEHIFITVDDTIDYIPTFTTVRQNKVRDRELLVLKTFQKLEQRPVVPRLADYNYQTTLDLEEALKTSVAPAERASQLLFDSLCTVYQVSRKFKKLTKAYVHNRYDHSVLGLYLTYRDTLLAHQVYWDKLRALLPQVNGLTKTRQFNENMKGYTNGLYTWLFPYKGIQNMVNAGRFRECFDTVAAHFRGPARDYLLSRVMYQASVTGKSIPSSYRKQYRRYSMNRGYRKIVARAARAYTPPSKDSLVLPNELLEVDGKTKVVLEQVLDRHRGKYVLLDLWASWCMPCIEEMPALQELKKRYPADKITFLSVSVDASIPAWQRRLSQLQGDSLTSYLLLNKDNAALVKHIGLTTIPRYLLYGREGQIINFDAPGPSDPALRELLDQLLLK